MSIQFEERMHTHSSSRALTEQSKARIRIAVADDQRLFRESIAGMLNGEPFIEVVGAAGNGLEAVELVRQMRPDVVLMDVKMPNLNGIEALRQIKAELPETRVILLTTFTADGYVLEGLAAGANGYVLKDISTVGLVSAIRAVYNGE